MSDTPPNDAQLDEAQLELLATISTMSDALEVVESKIPSWRAMPVTALFYRMQSELEESRHWAFTFYSPEHTEEWELHAKEYIAAFKHKPGVQNALDDEKIGAEPRVVEELVKCLMILTGLSVTILVRLLECEDEVDPVVAALNAIFPEGQEKELPDVLAPDVSEQLGAFDQATLLLLMEGIVVKMSKELLDHLLERTDKDPLIASLLALVAIGSNAIAQVAPPIIESKDEGT